MGVRHSNRVEAARAMLDTIHAPLKSQPKQDDNNYTLGNVGEHNVVVACLSEYGVVPAAIAVKTMQFTFPYLRFGLMVGIGGGIPSAENDIRLGDIVVSLPTGQGGGVIQYDLGRMEVDGFKRLGILNKPPKLLRTVIPTLKSTRTLGKEISELVDQIFGEDEDTEEEWTYPVFAKDILFKADYTHLDKNPTCDACAADFAGVVIRDTCKTKNPKIHYGNIASGNSVMKDGELRDRLAKRDNVICFEMEAAGLMDDFPCLVIRGISDYADSHKNWKWQPHATAVAAGYAKKLLLLISPQTVESLEPIRKNHHWMVPRLVHPLFTGRKEILTILQEKFCDSREEHPATELEQKRFIIHGIGGSGKSEVCPKFANENRERFWGIFWIDASSVTSIKRDFSAAAIRACNRKDMDIVEGKLWFENTEHTWLLILDNADDITIDYSRYFLSGSGGCILMTTRNHQYEIYYTVGHEKFEKLEMEDAVSLLLKASGIKEDLWQDYDRDACILVDFLAQHALALTQAGAFIRQGNCTLKHYPTEFKRQRQRLLESHSEQATSEYGSVYATFEVSAKAMKSSSDRKFADALELLNILANLHLEGVPEEMFTKAWNFSRKIAKRVQNDRVGWPSTWHVSHLPRLMRPLDSTLELDLITLRQAREVLHSFSLIAVNPVTGDISMHPLAHARSKDRLKPTEQKDAWVTTLATLSLSCCVRNDVGASEIATLLSTRIGHEIPLQSGNWRDVQYVLAASQRNVGKYKEAMQLIQEVVSFDAEKLNPKDHDRLCAQAALAQVTLHLELGQNREAIQLLESVVKIRRTTLHSTHLDLLSSQHDLASAYSENSQPQKALKLLKKLVKIQQKELDSTHPGLLLSQHELAIAYLSIGKPQKALSLQKRVVKIHDKMLLSTHPNLLVSEHVLAKVYSAIGQQDEALKLQKKVVKTRQATLNPTHSDRLQSESELGRIYGESGYLQIALRLLKNVVKIQQQTLDSMNSECLVSKHRLAWTYADLGYYRKAIKLLEEVVKTERAMPNPTYQYFVAAKRLLSECIANSDKHLAESGEGNVDRENRFESDGTLEGDNEIPSPISSTSSLALSSDWESFVVSEASSDSAESEAEVREKTKDKSKVEAEGDLKGKGAVKAKSASDLLAESVSTGSQKLQIGETTRAEETSATTPAAYPKPAGEGSSPLICRENEDEPSIRLPEPKKRSKMWSFVHKFRRKEC